MEAILVICAFLVFCAVAGFMCSLAIPQEKDEAQEPTHVPEHVEKYLKEIKFEINFL